MNRRHFSATAGMALCAAMALGLATMVFLQSPARADTAGILDSVPVSTTDGRQI